MLLMITVVIMAMIVMVGMIVVIAAVSMTVASILVAIGAIIMVVVIVVMVVAMLRTSSFSAWIATTVEHDCSITLQLQSDLSIDEEKEGVLIHLIVKVVWLVGSLFEPGPRHIDLVMKVVPRV